MKRFRYDRLLIGPAITIGGPLYVRTLFYAHGVPLDPSAVQALLSVSLIFGVMATLGVYFLMDGD